MKTFIEDRMIDLSDEKSCITCGEALELNRRMFCGACGKSMHEKFQTITKKETIESYLKR